MSGLAAGLLSIDNPAAHPQTNGVFASAEAFEGRDHNQLNSQWPADLGNKQHNVSILFARGEFGAQWQNWRVGVLHRGDGVMYANRDATNLAQQNVTASGYDTNRTYSIDYRVRGFEASGFKMSKSLDIPLDESTFSNTWKLRGGVAVSVLRGKQLKQESISGQIVTTSSTDFNGGAQQSMANSAINTADPRYFNAPYGKQLPFSGNGYAADVGVTLKHIATGTSVELVIADIAGRMDWYNVPNYDAALNTANKFYDASGYANFNPTASSVSRYRNIQQTLDRKIRLSVSYPIRSWQLNAAADHTQGYTFLQTGIGYHATEKLIFKAEYDHHYKTIGLGVVHPYLELLLRIDNTQFDSAKALGLSAKFKMPM